MKTSPTPAKKYDHDSSPKEKPTQMPATISPSSPVNSKLAIRHKRFGWTSLLIFVGLGTLLEGLLGFKSIGLLLDPLKRELWRLAHFHGAMLAIINLVYVFWADNNNLLDHQQKSASRALIGGSVCLPIGFFIGGIAHPEGDPGIAIFLVPIGALMICYAIGLQVLAAWKTPK
jgi:hypothetical protein